MNNPHVSGALGAQDDRLALGVSGLGAIGFQITGTWTGTISFDASVDGLVFVPLNVTPPNSPRAVTSASANGIWAGSAAGLTIARLRFSTFGSGQAVVTLQGAAGTAGVTVDGGPVIPTSGSVSASGNNTLLTPAAGHKLRIHYAAYNPSAPVEVAFRFGAAGGLFLRNNLTVGGSVIAKDFGNLRYIEGAPDDALILNLSAAVATIWNATYVEV